MRYTYSVKPALVVIGIGNPGKSYDNTRHNAGFKAVDALVKFFEAGEWKDKQKFLGVASEGRIGIAPVLFVKPTTFMNKSGESVRKLVDFYKLDPAQQILILTDDIDLPMGSVRLRMNGGPGTHNGLKSIVETLGEGFPRLRIGIGPKPETGDLANWVLSAFNEEEQRQLGVVEKTLPDMLKNFVLEKAE